MVGTYYGVFRMLPLSAFEFNEVDPLLSSFSCLIPLVPGIRNYVKRYIFFLIAYVATTGNNASFWHFKNCFLCLLLPYTTQHTLTVILSVVLTRGRVHLLTSQYPTRRRPPSLGRGTNAIIFWANFCNFKEP